MEDIMKHYLVVLTIDNEIDLSVVMDTIGVMFMSQNVNKFNLSEHQIGLLVETDGMVTEYQRIRQADILKQLLGLNDVLVLDCSNDTPTKLQSDDSILNMIRLEYSKRFHAIDSLRLMKS